MAQTFEQKRSTEEKQRFNKLIEDLDVQSQFEDVDERKQAVVLAKKYLNDYAFEYISDKNTLKQLIYLEMINIRLQKMLNGFYKDSQAVPVQMMDGLHKNVMQITALKETLGLVKDGKEEVQTGLSTIDVLKKKFKKWREENQGSRTLVCPECSKMIMLKIRTDAWEAEKHVWFKDRFLANDHLVKMYQIGKITKEDVALVLGTSPDYTEWLISKWYKPNTIKAINEIEEAQVISNQLDVDSGVEVLIVANVTTNADGREPLIIPAIESTSDTVQIYKKD